MGIWLSFDVLVLLYLTICHVYEHIYCKATCVPIMTHGALPRAYGPLGGVRVLIYDNRCSI